MTQPEIGTTWWWHGFEAWRVVSVDSCNDEFGEEDRMFVTIISKDLNQLRTVWTKSFYKIWDDKRSKTKRGEII